MFFFRFSYINQIILIYFLGHWGECNPNTCTNNALYSQEDNKMALEIKDLVNQHKVNDNLNNEIATRSFGSGTFDDCPCVHVLECERTKSLLELMKGLSRSHPERSSIMTYVKSQICDEQNQKVRCCGQQQKTTKVRTTTTTWQQTRQISVNEQVCKINKYIYQSLEIRCFWYRNFFFSFLILCNFEFFLYECPILCQHRSGQS